MRWRNGCFGQRAMGDLDQLVELSGDRRLIPGIYNYCFRRCHQCQFTDRCLSFKLDPQSNGAKATERTAPRDDFRITLRLLEDWCSHEGVSPAPLHAAFNEPAFIEETKRIDDHVQTLPLMKAAEQALATNLRLLRALRHAARFETWTLAVLEALDTLEALVPVAASKISRALHGQVEGRLDGEPECRQADWNGSAKVAILALRECVAAWNVLFSAGDAPEDSRVRAAAQSLQELELQVNDTFPLARYFVRPGFD